MKLPAAAMVAAVMASLAAGPAAAGEARCIWEHYPEAKRAMVLAGDLATVSLTMRTVVTNQEYTAALIACGVTAQTARAAGRAINAYVLKLRAELALASETRLPGDRLEAAWTALGEPLKARLVRHTLDDAADPDSPFDAVQAFADGLGLTGKIPEDEVLALTSYLLSRTALAVYEPRF